MNIVWIGNHEEGLQAFQETAQTYGVKCFITLDDTSFAKRSAGSRRYKDICDIYGIPYYTVNTIKEDLAFGIISEYTPDLIVVLGWSEILPKRILELPSIGTVGTHASLLPHNRGSAPINWALIHGEKITGNTLMWLDENVDTGKIVDQISFPITVFDTCKTLYEKVAETNAVMLSRLLGNLALGKEVELVMENRTAEPILPRRRPKDGLVCWNQSAEVIYNFIRALTSPYPGAFTFLNGEKWLLWEAAYIPAAQREIMPGTILGTSYGFAENAVGVIVAAENGLLQITKLEDTSGKQYSGEELYQLGLTGVFCNE